MTVLDVQVNNVTTAAALSQMSATNTSTFATSSIFELASSLPQLSTFTSLLKSAGLADTLSAGMLTVFAPTNDAFARLPGALLTFLTSFENRQTLVYAHEDRSCVALSCNLLECQCSDSS